jgi:hypothetical protein
VLYRPKNANRPNAGSEREPELEALENENKLSALNFVSNLAVKREKPTIEEF